MKFICEGEDLKSAVTVALHGTSTKSINPILEGIKIVADKDTVTFFATDLEIYMRKTIRADVKQEGSVVLPGKLFAEYVNKIASGPITFTSAAGTAVIEHGQGNDGNFSCLSDKEYPDLIDLDAKPAFAVRSVDLRQTVAKTLPFVALDNSRPVLRGALFEIDADSNTLTVVGLDGFRMSKVVKPIIRPSLSAKIIIPGRALEEIRRLLPLTDPKEEVNLILENKFIQITVGPIVFASRLIDGDFVNYKQIIPTEFSSNIVVETTPLLASVSRAGLLAGVNKINLLTLSTADKCLEIYANNEVGKINERVPANLDGQDIKIAFNAKFMFDALNTIEDEFIKLSFTGPLAPCVITNAQKSDYLFLVLPVRLG